MNRLTKSEAKDIISNLGLKPIDTYAACVKRDYAKVMAEEKKPRRIKKPEPIIEEIQPAVASVETETVETAPEVVIEKEKE